MSWKDDSPVLNGNWKDESPVYKPEDEVSSYGRGFAQGSTIGLRDEAAGALKNPFGALKQAGSFLGYDTTGDSDVEEYKKERDESRRLDDVALEQDPVGYMGGELSPTILASLIPVFGQVGSARLGITGAKALSGAVKGAKAGTAIAKGAALGGAYGAGSSRSEDLKGLATDTAKGAAISGGMSALPSKAALGVGGGLLWGGEDIKNGDYEELLKKIATTTSAAYLAPKAISKITPKRDTVKKFADDMAYNATEANPEVVKEWRLNAERKPFEPTQGDFLRRNKIVDWFDSPDDIGKKAWDMNKEAGEQIGEWVKEAQSKGATVDHRVLMDNFRDAAMFFRNKKLSPDQYNKLMEDVSNVNRRIDLEDLHKMAIDQKKLAYDTKKGVIKDSHAAELADTRQDILEKGVEASMEALDPHILKAYQAEKDLFGRTDHVGSNWLSKSAKRNQQHFGGTVDVATGLGTQVATGSPTASILAVLGRRLGVPRIASTTAKVGWSLADAMEAVGKGNLDLYSPAVNTAIRANLANEKEQHNFDALLERLGFKDQEEKWVK